EESDRLNRLVEEAAKMARLEAGKMKLQLAPQDPATIVHAALQHSSKKLDGRKIDLQIDSNLPLVHADSTASREALVHLLENAAKYSPSGEPIVVRADATANFVQISVADRGPGIDDLEQSLIFEKFYRGKGQRYIIQGTGMGLPISKALTEAQG